MEEDPAGLSHQGEAGGCLIVNGLLLQLLLLTRSNKVILPSHQRLRLEHRSCVDLLSASLEVKSDAGGSFSPGCD